MKIGAVPILLVGLLACARVTGAPEPGLSAGDVIRFQIEALADDETNDGIAATFRFASPANKEMTGPLERFIEIVRAPAYRPLINHVAAEYGELFSRNGHAAQVVTVTARDGSRHAYLFQLSRQTEGLFRGCWMTDSVHRVEDLEDPGVAI